MCDLCTDKLGRGREGKTVAKAMSQTQFLWNIKSSYLSCDKADLISVEFDYCC